MKAKKLGIENLGKKEGSFIIAIDVTVFLLTNKL